MASDAVSFPTGQHPDLPTNREFVEAFPYSAPSPSSTVSNIQRKLEAEPPLASKQGRAKSTVESMIVDAQVEQTTATEAGTAVAGLGALLIGAVSAAVSQRNHGALAVGGIMVSQGTKLVPFLQSLFTGESSLVEPITRETNRRATTRQHPHGLTDLEISGQAYVDAAAIIGFPMRSFHGNATHFPHGFEFPDIQSNEASPQRLTELFLTALVIDKKLRGSPRHSPLLDMASRGVRITGIRSDMLQRRIDSRFVRVGTTQEMRQNIRDVSDMGTFLARTSDSTRRSAKLRAQSRTDRPNDVLTGHMVIKNGDMGPTHPPMGFEASYIGWGTPRDFELASQAAAMLYQHPTAKTGLNKRVATAMLATMASFITHGPNAPGFALAVSGATGADHLAAAAATPSIRRKVERQIAPKERKDVDKHMTEQALRFN